MIKTGMQIFILFEEKPQFLFFKKNQVGLHVLIVKE